MVAERKRVLIVEDDTDTRECLSELFRMLGHEPCIAATGAEAIRLFAQESPTVVFIDIGLPDMSGHDLARTLRLMADSRAVRIVALTGWSQPRVINASMDAGMDLHVVKPIGYSALRGILGDASRSAAHAGTAPN